MKKEVKIQQQILTCLIIIIIILGINTIVLAVKGGLRDENSTLSTNNTNGEGSSNSDNGDDGYDVSMMEKASIKDILKMFDDKSTKVIYVGRSTCGACVAFLPVLVQAQNDYNYKTVYLNSDTISSSSEGYSDFIKKLDKQYTMNVNGQNVTDEFGTFFGYTPTVIIIKNGKMLDGTIGSDSYANFSAFLEKNGITK